MTHSNVETLGRAALVAVRGRGAKRDSSVRTYLPRGSKQSVTLYDTALTQAAYGPGVTVMRKPPIRYETIPTNGRISVTLYDTALSQSAYGAPALGDLFNDIMGAVVPGWDQRPEWMRKIRIKPDPNKIIQAATKMAPKAAPQVVQAAEQAGLNVYVQTPTGSVPVTPWTADLAMRGYGLYTQAKEGLAAVPGWVWLAGGGIVLLLLAMPRR